MNKTLQFLAKKSVYLVGIALAILANPFTYLVIGTLMIFVRNIFGESLDTRSISYSSGDLFTQAMILASFIGFLVVIASRLAAWILRDRDAKFSKS